MKKTLNVLLLAGLLANVSCGGDSEAKNTETQVAPVDTPQKTEAKEEIVSRYNYDKDWEIIKTAIIKKDIEGIKDWLNPEVDAENFIETCQSDFFLKAIKKAKYEDLKVVEKDGETFLVFSASETGVAEDGQEIGSAIEINMLQGEPSLKIESMNAAG